MKGLDLRKLKKVSSDDKTTVFKHDSGHELKVAHAGLSPKLLKELQSLPMHGQKMKDGGQPDPQPNASPDDSAQSAPAAPVPVPADYTQGVSDPGPAAITGNNPNNPTPDQTEQAPDASQGAAPPAWGDKTSAASAQPITAGQIASQPVSAGDALGYLSPETLALRNDFNNGHITPETYHDLFAKKDTLGKLGMMFGLLVGGAGAGLSHQPNALLGMMDKEIDRDLDAQKQTKSNQFNALNLAESHYRNEVSAHLAQQQGALAESTTALNKANLPILAANLRKQTLENAFLAEATRNAGLSPENTPTGQRARAGVGFLSNAVDAQQAQRNQQVAQQIAANGQQVQQGQVAPQNYITTPEDDRTYKMLGALPDAAMSAGAKAEFQKQYLNAKDVESRLPEVDAIFNEMKKNRTLGGNLAARVNPNALAGVGGGVGALAGEAAGVAAAPYTGGLSLPAGHAAAIGLGGLGAAAGEGIGQMTKTGLRMMGGQQETNYETAQARFEKLAAQLLKNTPITDTARGNLIEKFSPTIMDGEEAMNNKLQGFKQAVIDAQDKSALGASRRKKNGQ